MLNSLKAILFSSILCVFSASATIQIQATRIIFNAAEKEQTVRINNVGEQPELVQVWLSTDANKNNTVKEDLPFMINPPAARINGQKGKVFRIFQLEEAKTKYPSDRETVLWFSALDIPADSPDSADKNQLKMAFRTLIKFFYRPAGLKGNLIESANNVQWQLKKTAQGYDVIGTNQSPFHITVAKAWLTDAQGKNVEITGDMIAPYSSLAFHFTKINGLTGKGIFKFNFVSDLGAYIERTHNF